MVDGPSQPDHPGFQVAMTAEWRPFQLRPERDLRHAWAAAIACACVSMLAGCVGELPTREELLERLNAEAADAQLNDGVDAADAADVQDVADADVGAGEVDGSSDAADAPDGDVDSADASDVVLTCPAAPGCSCKDGSKCASGVCLTQIDFTSPDLNKACAASCLKGQPCMLDANTVDPDSVCAPVEISPTQSNWACVPRWGTLCDPCQLSAACLHVGQPIGAACVNFGPAGNFCGTPCLTAGDCASGFDCLAVTSIEGKSVQQCVPIPSGSGNGLGECTCSNVALHKKLATTCFAPSYDKTGALIGKCTGERLCDVDSLSACSAPKPKDEVCDTFDNDCDGLIDEGTCDDGKPCTTDFCAGAADCTHTTLDGNSCDDGDPCTFGDVCVQDQCLGVDKTCAGSACVAVQCNPTDGSCDFALKPDTTACDDGNACSSGDICLAGNCSGGSVVCDDANPCTNDSCAPKIGCMHDANASLCNDNSACTDFDQCVDGKCLGKAKMAGCDDANPCTDDACEAASGCVHLANSATCSDGNACTLDDACQDGKCASGVNECTCAQDADCAAKDDGNLCNGTLFCNMAAVPFQCEVKASTVVTCAASSNPCLASVCVPVSGACEATAVTDGTPCDADGSVCTVGDGCQAGACTAGPTTVCNDGNVCTEDACDSQIGCTKIGNAAPCSDGNACTLADQCQNSSCVSGAAVTCVDGNPCTVNTCQPDTGACLESPISGPCDDGNLCTTGDTCQGGTCQSGLATQCLSATKCASGKCDVATGNCLFSQVLCDDGSPCTNDSCAAATGCVFAAKSCDDNNACTVDTCDVKTGACVSTPSNCDDGNPCTVDTCSVKSGCASTPQVDGTVCSSGAQVCVGGACVTPFASPPAQGGIAGGQAHTCVRVFGGGEACWGANLSGQLGDASNTDSPIPVPLSAKEMSSVIDLDCGTAFSCAIRGTTNTVRCWGANASGQLGNGGATASNVPVNVLTTATAPATAVHVTTGSAFACEVLSTHKVWCWGNNSNQQLGLGFAVGNGVPFSSVPAQVNGMNNVSAIAAGSAHVCAIQNDVVYCWGRNKDGQCGQATAGDVNAPASVGLSNATAIAAGDDFTCALASGSVWCWGNNQHGQLANGTFGAGSATPVQIGLNNATDITAGLGHVCIRTNAGSAVCWGRNDYGQVGNGTTADALSPSVVPGLSSAYRIGAGDLHSCAVRFDGSVWCWGNNASGALGVNNGSEKPVLKATEVFGSAPK
jgi:alpha-tubulin suppressor-like RCC1 family protein